MQRSWLGADRLAVALMVTGLGACMSSGPRPLLHSEKPPAGASPEILQYWHQLRDSLAAQQVADRDGPRVRVSARYGTMAGSRQVDASFTLDDDAYIMVGHLDASGRVQVVFPSSPEDDGFVRGGRSYRVPSFFGGFAAEYALRRSQDLRYRSFASRRDSYDGGGGYIFLVASWRPMRFDRIADNGKWAAYELSDASYVRDPRPAVDELAALVAGDNREAYTVEYASALSSIAYGAFASNALASDYCSSGFGYGYGSSPYGLGIPLWAFSPYASALGLGYGSAYGLADSFFDDGSGCRVGYPRYSFQWGGFGIVGPPRVQGDTTSTKPRSPLDTGVARKPLQGPVKPSDATQRRPSVIAAANGDAGGSGLSTPYQRPGLVIEGGPTGGPAVVDYASLRSRPGAPPGERPSIEEMVSRRRTEPATQSYGRRVISSGAGPQDGFRTHRGGGDVRAYTPGTSTPSHVAETRHASPGAEAAHSHAQPAPAAATTRSSKDPH